MISSIEKESPPVPDYPVENYNSATVNTFYVSPLGNDGNNGSITAPFLTIQHGLNLLIPGDTLLVRAGTYFEKLNWTTSGTAGNLIVLKNYPGEKPIIDGSGNAAQAMILAENKSYFSIEGLIFQQNYGQYAKGIHITGEGEFITIKNCILRDMGWHTDPNADPYSISPSGNMNGIIVNGRTSNGIHDVFITDNRLHDLITGNSEALTLAGNVYNFLIARDTIHNTKNIGIDVAGHFSWAVDPGVPDSLNQGRDGIIQNCVVYENRRFSNVDAPAGIYTDGARNVLIDGNISYRNVNGISVGCENVGKSGSHIIVVNNIVFDNDNNGIYFGSNAATIELCTLKNNTFVENGNLGPYHTEVALQNSENCVILQNILIPKTSSHYAVSIFGYSVTNLIVDNNLAYRYNEDPEDLYVRGHPIQFTPMNSLSANPLFVDSNVSNPDFNLLSASPAIDLGLKEYGVMSTLDQIGHTRVVNGKLDHGALEAPNGNCPGVLTVDSTMILQGSFTANTKLILDLQGDTLIHPLYIQSPEVEIISPIVNENLILIVENICSN
jgi:hypothetical protein